MRREGRISEPAVLWGDAALGGQLGDLPLPALHIPATFLALSFVLVVVLGLVIRVPLQNQCGIRITGRQDNACFFEEFTGHRYRRLPHQL